MKYINRTDIIPSKKMDSILTYSVTGLELNTNYSFRVIGIHSKHVPKPQEYWATLATPFVHSRTIVIPCKL